MEGHHCLISSKVGNRVKAVIGSSTTVYVGTIYEQTTSGGSMTITKYYQAGGQRIALRVNGVVRWLAADHPSAGDLQSPLRPRPERSRRDKPGLDGGDAPQQQPSCNRTTPHQRCGARQSAPPPTGARVVD